MSSFDSQKLPKSSVWLVTGVSTGIGLSLISQITAAGHRVVGLSRNPSKVPLPPTSNAENTQLLPVELSNTDSIHKAYEAAVAHFGRIDVLVNNAGYGLVAELESLTDAAHRDVMEINYFAPATLTRLAIASMRTQSPPGGTIVQITSIGGVVGSPGLSAYQSAKHALEGLTKAVARELDPEWKIKLISIQPGGVCSAFRETMQVSERHPAYVGKSLPTEFMASMFASFLDKVGAEPEKVAGVVVDVVVDGNGPPQLPLGADAWAMGIQHAREYQENLEKWKTVIESTSPGDAKEALKELGLLSD